MTSSHLTTLSPVHKRAALAGPSGGGGGGGVILRSCLWAADAAPSKRITLASSGWGPGVGLIEDFWPRDDVKVSGGLRCGHHPSQIREDIVETRSWLGHDRGDVRSWCLRGDNDSRMAGSQDIARGHRHPRQLAASISIARPGHGRHLTVEKPDEPTDLEASHGKPCATITDPASGHMQPINTEFRLPADCFAMGFSAR